MCTRLTVEELWLNVRADPETGKLWWRRPLRSQFQSDKLWRISLARRTNREALSSPHSAGYLHGKINGHPLFAHVAMFALVHGVWPSGQIDHIDGNRTNNRISNLRDVSASDNQRNQSRRSTNRSGFTGVHWHAQSKSWRAQIRHDGRTVSLGCFKTISEAARARAKANVRFGYHENHGRPV